VIGMIFVGVGMPGFAMFLVAITVMSFMGKGIGGNELLLLGYIALAMVASYGVPAVMLVKFLYGALVDLEFAELFSEFFWRLPTSLGRPWFLRFLRRLWRTMAARRATPGLLRGRCVPSLLSISEKLSSLATTRRLFVSTDASSPVLHNCAELASLALWRMSAGVRGFCIYTRGADSGYLVVRPPSFCQFSRLIRFATLP
jgi:hypothetical protein